MSSSHDSQRSAVDVAAHPGKLAAAAWFVMLLLCALVSVYAVAFLFVPSLGSPGLKEKFAGYPLATWSHLLGSAVALVCGPWQFLTGLRSRRPTVHRLLGRIYVAGVFAGGLGGLRMAFTSDGGYVTHFGFGLLGVFWLVTLAVAFRAIQQRNFEKHRAWMIRNFSLTFAAVTLRLYLPLSAICGIPFPTAYQAISWIAWVPNLLIVECYLRRGLREQPRLVPETAEQSHA